MSELMDREDKMQSWAEAVEQQTRLPAPEEYVKDGIKTRVEYLVNDKGDKVKITSTFKIETKKVPKPIADRKKWRKFGIASKDPRGPNPANTLPAEEVKIQFIRNRAGEFELSGPGDGDPFEKLRNTGTGMHCRYCKQKDHFSVNCPYKDQLSDLQEEAAGAAEGKLGAAREMEAQDKMQRGTYVPPSLRSGAPARGGTTMDTRVRDENTVRVTNLPEDTTDQDLRDLFGQVGRVNRIFLAKDKNTGRSKGFAFVTYERRDDAEKAILTISGHRYDYVILKVEWAKQSN